ncbi:MAG TPA: alpha/beta hydrolase-fold protein [Solirubrobacteraceae bacterium]|nr:alpha/beta hydrolase-fold protein [Solirubrobacteraceae bacterium]
MSSGRACARRGLRALAVVIALGSACAPSAGAASVQQWTTPGGQFVAKRDLFPRDLVDGKLVTTVVLPTGYRTRKCWPVLYLLHGSAQGVAGTSAPVSLQWLEIGDGELLHMRIPAILVLPGSGDTWWINNWWHGLRHPAFESWILQDIVPLVTRRLHVCPGRSEHSIAGLSMGGYGAIYLASQLPSYFGSAGSFSGVLSPQSANFLRIFPGFPTYWGPPNQFYANGHDPLALVGNLRNTRIFVGAGNGTPTPGEDTSVMAVFEELEFAQESASFVARARQGGVPVTFDQHGGTHTVQTWFASLSDMLTWNPFKHVTDNPRSWTFSTVATTGKAWGYSFAFSRYAPPKSVVQFSLARGVFRARGAGIVKITLPGGKSVTGALPFDIRRGRVVELGRTPMPRLVGGYEQLTPLSVSVTQPVTGRTAPIDVSFRTTQALPANQEYQVAIASFSPTGGASCTDTTFRRVFQPTRGRTVSVSVVPPASATVRGRWCPGLTVVGVSALERNSRALLGNILGYTIFTMP